MVKFIAREYILLQLSFYYYNKIFSVT